MAQGVKLKKEEKEQILILLQHGHTNEEISNQMNLSTRTISDIRKNSIFRRQARFDHRRKSGRNQSTSYEMWKEYNQSRIDASKTRDAVSNILAILREG